jgi:ribonuclease P protein component
MRFDRAEMFQMLYRTGRRLSLPGLVVRWIPAPDGQFRCGLVVRKKTVREAVRRNRIRRIVRDVMRTCESHQESARWLLVDVKEFPREGGYRDLRSRMVAMLTEGRAA